MTEILYLGIWLLAYACYDTIFGSCSAHEHMSLTDVMFLRQTFEIICRIFIFSKFIVNNVFALYNCVLNMKMYICGIFQ